MVNSSAIKLIAGPCSAESEQQVMTIAQAIKDLPQLQYFRAGIWKPRTSPNSFEGIGEKGLLWLAKVKKELNIPVITEVATPHHVELCLAHGIDAFWIGARTTVNPLYVQEIANALSGVEIPIYVKNPISPDLGLWIGAIERFKKSGKKEIAAIHRGFFTYEKQEFRNPPMWDVSVKLKTEIPDIQIICDPSHITGKSSLIQEVSQMALLYGMDGLMIETHTHPKEALSDNEQQVTPAQLKEIMTGLKQLNNHFLDVDGQLLKLRKKIGSIDQKIMSALSDRMTIVEEIAKLKRDNSASYFQVDRWKTILDEVKKLSNNLNLREELIEEVMHLIHKESLLKHHEVYKKKKR